MAHVHTGTKRTLGPQQHHQYGAPGGHRSRRTARRTARTCAAPQHGESPAQKPCAAQDHRRKHGALPRGDPGALNGRDSHISRRRNGSCSHRNRRNAGTATASSTRRAGKASLSANCAAKNGANCAYVRASAARRKPCSKAGCRSGSSPKARGSPPRRSGRSERARQSHFTKEEWLMFTQEQKERWDRNSIINTARWEGIALGEKRGELRVRARLRSTAKALLKSRVPLRIIAESTGLSPEEIRAL